MKYLYEENWTAIKLEELQFADLQKSVHEEVKRDIFRMKRYLRIEE
jgi:hypothetical protein